MILEFDEYSDMGGVIQDEAAYKRHAARAEATIDRMTHGRIRNEFPVRESVKYAAFDLIESMFADAQSAEGGREIASMSNDGMSISYVQGGGTVQQERARRYAGIVREYLECETDANGTALLYAGVDA